MSSLYRMFEILQDFVEPDKRCPHLAKQRAKQKYRRYAAYFCRKRYIDAFGGELVAEGGLALLVAVAASFSRTAYILPGRGQRRRPMYPGYCSGWP